MFKYALKGAVCKVIGITPFEVSRGEYDIVYKWYEEQRDECERQRVVIEELRQKIETSRAGMQEILAENERVRSVIAKTQAENEALKAQTDDAQAPAVKKPAVRRTRKKVTNVGE